MYLPAAIFLLLLAQGAPTALAFSPHRSLGRAAERLHRFAKRNSAGLARDLKITFQGLSVDQSEPDSGSQHRVYCVRPDAFTSLQGNATSTSPATATRTTTSSGAASATATSAFKLVESHSGSNFFDGWTFWDAADPTNGIVDFLSQSDAQSNGLIEVNSAGNAVMKVETTSTITGNRKSIRITTANTFTQGIFVLDAVHMPQGCGTWPAFWSNGPDWPTFGEIDILEGVNDYTNNQATIHTASGCTMPSGASAATLNVSSTLVGALNCAAAETNNQGCGMRSNSNITYGSGFNSVGGGVYAMAWDDNQISVNFFPRGSIPQDLLAEAPQPSTWGTPMALWPSTDCNMQKFFQNHSIIFDTTLCGDWAGGVWSSTGAPGQDTSCATRTGYSTCNAFVQGSGASFADAYWEVASVKVYQTSRTP
ncbi:glycoside hydrolase family 16 protein [Phellopilus nigrolimitatus]|nr:glycoside hydrolase family 16 protein [Phellopilus nigrolimitatus]